MFGLLWDIYIYVYIAGEFMHILQQSMTVQIYSRYTIHEFAYNIYIYIYPTTARTCKIYNNSPEIYIYIIIYIYPTTARTCKIYMNSATTYIHATTTRTWQICYNRRYISCSIASLASPASWYISFRSIDRQRGIHMLQAGHTPTRQPGTGT